MICLKCVKLFVMEFLLLNHQVYFDILIIRLGNLVKGQLLNVLIGNTFCGSEIWFIK